MRSVPAILVFVSLLFVGCDASTKRSLGLAKQAPDEFKVIAAKPLVMPPNFSVRPDNTMESNVTKEDQLKSGEKEFLNKMRGYNALPGIRNELDQEYEVQQPKSKKPLLDIPLFRDETKENKVLDPKEEKERLEKQKGKENKSSVSSN